MEATTLTEQNVTNSDAADEANPDATIPPPVAAKPKRSKRVALEVQEIPLTDRITTGVEAVLLSTDRPVQPRKLGVAFGLLTDDQTSEGVSEQPVLASDAQQAREVAVENLIARAVAALNEAYASTGRAFRIESVSGGLRIMTLPEHAQVVSAFRKMAQFSRLSKSAIETLSIIAYRQPVTRAELEAIRGVSCGEILRTLLERRLITIKGRAEELGRPILYGTTKQFLDHFGLASLKDMPTIEEFKLGA
jgi:segregation and condensation protein B